jgi:hypothetical protein
MVYSDTPLQEDRVTRELVNMILKYILCDLPPDLPQLPRR